MKEVKKYVCICFCVLGVFIVMLGVSFWVIVCIPEDTFSDHYMNALQAKYEYLVNTDEPKIIIVGGSNTGFGIRESLLEERTGYKVANMGIHAGLGGLFETEITKANINEGDIVLLAYEYGYGKNTYFEKLGIDTVMSGIDSKIEMYRYVPISNFNEVFAYLFTFANKKRAYEKNAAGTYSRSSFDELGRMVLQREKYIIEDYERDISDYGQITEDTLQLEENAISYLKKYKEYVESRGAKVYFTAPPLLQEALKAEANRLDDLVEQEEDKIGIKYISDPRDYVFPSYYMFDTIYHCNTKGEEYRTELLAEDLKNIGIEGCD